MCTCNSWSLLLVIAFINLSDILIIIVQLVLLPIIIFIITTVGYLNNDDF